jgi:hypothetical protein
MDDKVAARIVGALFLISTAGMATGGIFFIEPLRGAPEYLTLIAENEMQMISGALLMLINSFAIVGIAIVMFPILKRHSEKIALTYLSFRIIEGIVLIFGLTSYLALLTISIQYVKLGASDTPIFKAFSIVAMNGNYYSFQIGMLALCIGSFAFCYSLYQTKLIPRFLSVWGFIGYFALFAGVISALYGYDISTISFIPGGLFELFLPFWLFAKGFDSSAFREGPDPISH